MLSDQDEEFLVVSKKKFLSTLENLVVECDTIVRMNGPKNSRNEYWRDRKQTLLEIKQLWTETLGG